jgi:two-component system, chemotaxis family, sensor kinase CheA
MKLNLKTKILLGISILLIFAIIFNFYFAYQLFIKDKTSYIFESGLQKVESLSNQMAELITKNINRSNSYLLVAQKSKEDFQKLLNSDPETLLFAYRFNENEEWKIFTQQKENSSGENIEKDLKEWFLKSTKSKQERGKLAYDTFMINDRNLINLNLKDESGQISYILDFEKINSIFSEDNVFQNFLVDTKFNPLLNKEKETPPFLKALANEKNTKGTKILTDGENEYLTSFAKFPNYNFFVAGIINKDKAFSIAQDLIKRSLSFGLILLGVSLAFGLFFSIQITRPINRLLEATRWIAQGDFRKKVEVNTKDELRILGNSFNFMSGEIESLLSQKEEMINQLEIANVKLEDYSKNLEKMVEDRTKELKKANDFIGAMINSLDQGLMVFDKDIQCSDIYTKVCEDLFHVNPKGKSYPEVLGMNEKEATGVKKWSEIVFSEKIPFESALNLGPKEKVFGNDIDDDNFRHIKLQYYPMRGEDEKIENIVAVATDKTEEVRAVQDSLKKEAYVEMILKLVHSKKNFLNFISEAKEMVIELESHLISSPPNVEGAILLYHSMNGGFGTYSVSSLQSLARTSEQRIVDIRENGIDPMVEQKELIEDFNHFKEVFESFIIEITNIFATNRESVEIAKDDIDKLMQIVKDKASPEIYSTFSEYLLKEPIEEHFTSYAELVEQLGSKLNKPMSPVQFENGHIRIAADEHKDFFSVLVHLFRNCVDHGIESPSQRAENKKPPEGNILVSFEKGIQKKQRMLHIAIMDDGGGIDPSKVRKKLREINPEEDVDNISDSKVIYRIFDHSFSTAQEVTSVSGRGVGMSAILDIVKKKGGKLRVVSKPGVGSRFDFWLPTS